MKNILFLITILFVLLSCSKKIIVDSIKVQPGKVESTVTTINSGTVEALRQAELAFGTVGRVATIHSSVGTIVNTGAVIAELENADLKAVFEESEKEYSRSQELFKNGLVSISNLDAAKKNREVARINLEKTMIKAPFQGLITALDLKIGEFYQSAQALNQKPRVQIIDLEKRIIRGEIDEIDLDKVKNGQEASVKIPAFKKLTFKGVVTKVVPFVSTAKDQDRTSEIKLELIIPNTKMIAEIPVGASADVEIVVEKKEAKMIIPTRFILGVGSHKYVYKINGNKMIKSEIKIGVGNYDKSEILEGLSLNDFIGKVPDGVEDVEGLSVEKREIPWP
jgi:membrane fusion protein (multidrug efflux system)